MSKSAIIPYAVKKRRYYSTLSANFVDSCRLLSVQELRSPPPCVGWHMDEPLHPTHPPEQPAHPLPAFLSFIILRTTALTATASISNIINVARFIYIPLSLSLCPCFDLSVFHPIYVTSHLCYAPSVFRPISIPSYLHSVRLTFPVSIF